ncbi:MAG: hypothetical protein ACLP5V_05705 [Candidatus Bathyarchaeia archaeon]
MNRQRYRVIGFVLILVGAVLGAWFGYLNVTNTSYALTFGVGAQQCQQYVSNGVPFDTVMVFIFGLVASFGLSMILNLHPPDKE